MEETIVRTRQNKDFIKCNSYFLPRGSFTLKYGQRLIAAVSAVTIQDSSNDRVTSLTNGQPGAKVVKCVKSRICAVCK